MLGLVYDPVHQECFKAVRDGGARLNGATIHVSPFAQLDGALLGTGFPYDRRNFADLYLSYFKALWCDLREFAAAGPLLSTYAMSRPADSTGFGK